MAQTATVATSTPTRFEALSREELRIESASGIELFLIQILPKNPKPERAVLLLHGAGSASSALWDLDVKDYSLMRYLARRGFATYALDLRGFGGSTMPEALAVEDPTTGAPAIRAQETLTDVRAAVQHVLKTSSVSKVDLFGWSWGCVVAGLYAAQHPEHVRRLVLLAPVYDRKWPKRHKTKGVYRTERRADHEKYFNPQEEEREVLDAFLTSLFRFTKGDVLRLPNGPYQDIYGADAPIWQANKIRSPTLVIRGDRDRASLHQHASKLFSDLTVPNKRYVVIGGAGHFPFRKRNHYQQLQELVGDFLLGRLVTQ